MAPLTRLIVASPVRAAAYLQATVWLVGFGVQFAIYRVIPTIPDWIPILADVLCALVITVLLLTRLRWWQRAGIAKRPATSSLWLVALTPAILFGLTLGPAAGLHSVPLEILALVSVGSVTEEFLNRGLILSALAPTGVRSAVIISSVLFGLVHGVSLLFSPSASVALLVVTSASHGSLWAAVRLRAGSIWPAVLSHAVFDLVTASVALRSNILSFGVIGAQLGIAFIAAGLAAFLIRSRGLSRVDASPASQSRVG